MSFSRDEVTKSLRKALEELKAALESRSRGETREAELHLWHGASEVEYTLFLLQATESSSPRRSIDPKSTRKSPLDLEGITSRTIGLLDEALRLLGDEGGRTSARGKVWEARGLLIALQERMRI